MMPSFCRETVTIKRAPFITERGAKVRDWTTATTITISNCSVQPVDSTGDTREREAATYTAVLYAPLNADVKKGDRITCSLGEFETVGVPMKWYSPTGATNHLQFRLKEWLG